MNMEINNQRDRIAKLKINNKVYNIYDGLNTVGRQREATVNIKNLNVSQNHAVIITLKGEHFVTDLNSSNGTYCDNIRIPPFKLQQVKHNSKIKFGDVLGTYTTEELDLDLTENVEATQDFTQTFYGRNTQIVDTTFNNNSEVEDIHEAPTQVVPFSQFKIPRSVTIVEEDIHEAITQPFDIVKAKNESNKSNELSISTNETINKENVEPTKNTNADFPSSSMLIDMHNIADGCHNDYLPFLENKDSFVCESNDSNQKSGSSSESARQIVDYESVEPCIANEDVAQTSIQEDRIENNDNLDCLDEDELTDCEDNVAVEEIPKTNNEILDHNSNDSTDLLKMDPKSDVSKTVIESDGTDPVEETGNDIPVMQSNDNTEKQNSVENKAPEEGEETDTEIDIPTEPNKNHINNLDDNRDSNDSSDFFKLDKPTKELEQPLDLGKLNINSSGKTTSTQSSSSECFNFKKKTVCQINDSSSDTDEDLNFRRAKKSSRIINSQDIESDSTDDEDLFKNKRKSSVTLEGSVNTNDDLSRSNVIARDSIINESDTEENLSNRVDFEKSIPATQNISAAELNDTDCIPATQEIGSIMPAKPKTLSQITNASSEESFRFGLTEMMTEESQAANKNINSQEPCYSKSLKSPVLIREERDDNELYDGATQKIDLPKKNTENSYEDNTDLYLASAQKVQPKKTAPETTETAIEEPPQALNKSKNSQEPCCSKSLKSPVLARDESEETDDTQLFEVQTQKIDFSKKTTENIYEDNTDLYLASTQKLQLVKPITSNILDESDGVSQLYDVATQKLDIPKKNAAKPAPITSKQTDESDFYLAATQQLPLDLGKKSALNKDDTDGIFSAPTQKVLKPTPNDLDPDDDDEDDDVFDKPTQYVPVSNVPKKFSFKKIDCNLDGSLSTLLKHDSERDMIKSSIEVDFSDLATHHVENRPVNPISQVLEKTFEEETEKMKMEEKLSVENKNEENNSKLNSDEDLVEKPDTTASKTVIPRKIKEREIEEVNKSNKDQKSKKETLPENKDKNGEKELSADSNKNIATNVNTQVSGSKRAPTKNKELSIDESKGNPTKPKTSKAKSSNFFNTQQLLEVLDDSSDVEDKAASVEKEHVTAESSLKHKVTKIDDTVPVHLSKEEEKAIPARTRKPRKRLLSTEGETSKTRKISVKEDKTAAPQAVRVSRRKLLSSSELNENLSIKEPYQEERTNTTINTTTSEINQSIAILESKIMKTKKSNTTLVNIGHLDLKVPKNRRSMAIVEQDEVLPADNTRKSNITRGRSKVSTKKSLPEKSSVSLRGTRKALTETVKPSASSTSAIMTESRVAKMFPENSVVVRTMRGEQKSVETSSKNSEQASKIILDKNVSEKTKKDIPESKNETKETSDSIQKPMAKLRASRVGKKVTVSEDNGSESSDAGSRRSESVVKTYPGKSTKRKHVMDRTASESSDASSISSMSTPKKQKMQLSETFSSPERGLRRQKPKVVFTMMESPQMESFIKHLGGSVVDSVTTCTVLVTEHVKRSQKLLCAVGSGKPICSPKWIIASKKAHEFLDPWDYILHDTEAEKKWKFSLKESLNKSKDHKLLENHHFLIQVITAVDVLRGAIEACGGKCIAKIPSSPLNNTYVISSPENQTKYKRILKQHASVKVIEAEAIFDGVLRQELRFSNHFLT
ncbi:mediator of DNA damage checkpoint protein 1-like isoform X2 [Sitophilus oryzae]|uniref:Mediator of DNA damage checkpoint protein 1 n=1 Tax=Sitophilus oryzae TaxID=7048 RepID=A0A6J2YTQ1_SITOR|nr:mediator of DNA damage checkpoint protein 1-like isoform X2 [Sitophilus oryzae]